ncbi:MAG: 6,7-dimethyl-8-ribityllumazine synthase [Chloroflexi bacterium]|nr:MAG: 6,7-dimethyl-8-ribityllumazine synthase [Chloroflexota bacterium]TME49921.1 MAG: 6,7-dimethyl-8-ribityllumazine synthase [Chloroflexota bacterium]
MGATPHLDGTDLHIAIVVARFNEDVTKRLLRGAQEVLQSHGVEDPDVYWVPGALELPVTALALAEKGEHDAIICLGCVVRGETFQFEVVAMQSASGLMQVQLDTGVPIAFGVLTTEDKDQALARSGPKNNKGSDAAEVAIEMANLLHSIQG